MKKNCTSFLSLGFFIGLIFVLAPSIWAHTEASPWVTNLYAGNPKPGRPPVIAGTVQVWNDTNYLYVKYLLDAEWQLVSTHLHVATSLAAFPQTKFGNPKVGNFEYVSPAPYDPGTLTDTYRIELTWPAGTPVFIAAHAVVRTISGFAGDVCGLASNLPTNVFVSLTYPGPSGLSYFDVTITGDGILDGSHLGWCVDTDNGISPYPAFASVYLTYNCPPFLLPAGIIEYPGNLDLVNWIINQPFVGQASPYGSGIYTFGDVQRAIWELIEDNPLSEGVGLEPWSQVRATEIVTAAQGHEGFIPTCGQKTVIILYPNGLFAQTVFVEFPVPCTPVYKDQTAWAGDHDDILRTFPGASWALYFQYVIQ